MASPIEIINSPLFNDPSLVNYWRFEGNSNDAKGSNNGTDTAISYTSTGAMFGQAASFNGSTSGIVFTGPAFGSAGSLLFYLNPQFDTTANVGPFYVLDSDSTGTNRYIFAYNTSATSKWAWYLNGTAVGDPLSTNPTIPQNQKTLVGLTWSGGNSQALNIAGVQIATFSVSFTNATPDKLYLGRRFNNANNFNGLIDEFAYLSRVVTQTEFTYLANGSWPIGWNPPTQQPYLERTQITSY